MDSFDKIYSETPEETKKFISKSLDIADSIIELMNDRGINQKQLAELLGKKESEISKWLSGFHNFTIKTISKIEAKLQQKLIETKFSKNQSKRITVMVRDVNSYNHYRTCKGNDVYSVDDKNYRFLIAAGSRKIYQADNILN